MAEIQVRSVVSTFSKLYCERQGCAVLEFRGKVFWLTLHWYAVPLAPLLMIGRHFESDRALIAVCGRASRMRQVFEAIADYSGNKYNDGWLRRQVKLRVSTRRLRRLAARYLPDRKARRDCDESPGTPRSSRRRGDESLLQRVLLHVLRGDRA